MATRSAPGKLRFIAHAIAWTPLLWLLLEAWWGWLSPNPIQDWVQRTGRASIYLLALSLAATPLSWIPGWGRVRPLRRTWGLYAFAYATLHVYLFVGVDYAWQWRWLLEEILTQKPYIWLGIAAWVMLIALAATSPWGVVRRMGARRWKRLHRLVYLAAPLAALHMALAVKGNLFTLQGDIARAFLVSVAIAGLLLARGLRKVWRERRQAQHASRRYPTPRRQQSAVGGRQ